MTKRILQTALIAAAVLVLAGPVLASGGEDSILNRVSSPNGVKDFARKIPKLDGIPPVPLPMPGEPDGGLGSRSAEMTGRPGPVAAPGTDGGSIGGSALIGPAGGSFVTPQMHGKREIQRLLKKLG